MSLPSKNQVFPVDAEQEAPEHTLARALGSALRMEDTSGHGTATSSGCGRVGEAFRLDVPDFAETVSQNAAALEAPAGPPPLSCGLQRYMVELSPKVQKMDDELVPREMVDEIDEVDALCMVDTMGHGKQSSSGSVRVREAFRLDVPDFAETVNQNAAVATLELEAPAGPPGLSCSLQKYMAEWSATVQDMEELDPREMMEEKVEAQTYNAEQESDAEPSSASPGKEHEASAQPERASSAPVPSFRPFRAVPRQAFRHSVLDFAVDADDSSVFAGLAMEPSMPVPAPLLKQMATWSAAVEHVEHESEPLQTLMEDHDEALVALVEAQLQESAELMLVASSSHQEP